MSLYKLKIGKICFNPDDTFKMTAVDIYTVVSVSGNSLMKYQKHQGKIPIYQKLEAATTGSSSSSKPTCNFPTVSFLLDKSLVDQGLFLTIKLKRKRVRKLPFLGSKFIGKATVLVKQLEESPANESNNFFNDYNPVENPLRVQGKDKEKSNIGELTFCYRLFDEPSGDQPAKPSSMFMSIKGLRPVIEGIAELASCVCCIVGLNS